jgi:hypothetical protein
MMTKYYSLLFLILCCILMTTLAIASTLNTPSKLRAVALSSSHFQLSWQDNSDNEHGFIVERIEAASANWTVVTILPANTTEYESGGMLQHRQYGHRIGGFIIQPVFNRCMLRKIRCISNGGL